MVEQSTEEIGENYPRDVVQGFVAHWDQNASENFCSNLEEAGPSIALTLKNFYINGENSHQTGNTRKMVSSRENLPKFCEAANTGVKLSKLCKVPLVGQSF